MQHGGNIRAHIKKIQKKKREKRRERENKNALSHARRLVVRRRDLVGVVRHLVYFLRERTREEEETEEKEGFFKADAVKEEDPGERE